jgi:hypothetical protein
MEQGEAKFGPTSAPCQQTDCGKCHFCRDMVKFGGSGRSNKVVFCASIQIELFKWQTTMTNWMLS